jgi:hypothetical protein
MGRELTLESRHHRPGGQPPGRQDSDDFLDLAVADAR